MGMDWKTWRRPTLPCLKTQYHGRWGFSRPSSGRDRVRAPRQDHQVVRSILGDVFPMDVSGGEVLVCAVCCCVSGDDFHAWCLDGRLSGDQNRLASRVTPLPHPACQRGGLPRPSGRSRFEVGFPLRCFQRLSRPHLATRPCHWRDNRCTRGMFIPVLSY